MTYFQTCTTINDVKALYRNLSKVHHPDMGGCTATMQAINNEYSFACAKLIAGGTLTPDEQEAEIINAEQYKSAINAIVDLPGITVELCGGWLWVSGNTYPVKDVLKTAGFFFASNKKMWYFRSPEYATNNRQKHSMEDIRSKYGSQAIRGGTYQRAIA